MHQQTSSTLATNKLMLNFVAHRDIYVLPHTLLLHTSLDMMKIGERNKDKVVDALQDSWFLPPMSILSFLFYCKRKSYGYLAPDGQFLTPSCYIFVDIMKVEIHFKQLGTQREIETKKCFARWLCFFHIEGLIFLFDSIENLDICTKKLILAYIIQYFFGLEKP